MTALIASLTLLLSAVEPGSTEVAAARNDLQFGNYDAALARATAALEKPPEAEGDRIELRRIAGLAAFSRNDPTLAATHFTALLELDPDHALDPFVAPPAAVRLFEQLRRDLAPSLDEVRKKRRAQTEELRKREAAQLAGEEARRRQAALADAAAARQLQGVPTAIHFLPLGIPQFQQGRPWAGALLAALQGSSAIVSLWGFWGYRSLLETRVVVLDNRQGPTGTFSVQETGIPFDAVDRADTYRWMQWAGAAVFYGSYAGGVADSLLHRPKTKAPTVQVSPTPGGAAAQLTLDF